MILKEFLDKIKPEDQHLFFEAASVHNQSNPKDSIDVQEAMTSKDAMILMPKVLQGTLQRAMEPLMIGSTLLATVQATTNVFEFPSMSAIRAFEIPEGGEFPKQNLDFQLHKTMTVKTTKKGVQFECTDECIKDSQWDVIGLHVQEAGRALQRLKEQLIWNEFVNHGHVRFDGHLDEGAPGAPTGVGVPDPGTGLSKYNRTLSTLDWIDLIMTLISNEYTPTDMIIHPLQWPFFIKTMFFGGLGITPKGYTQPSTIPIGPGALQAAQPFGLNLMVSPFIPMDKGQLTGTTFVIDRGEVGVMFVREPVSMDEWENMARDIRMFKMKERYGIGIRNEGRAIAVAQNIALAESYGFQGIQITHSI